MSQLLECYGEREGKIVREWLNPHVGFFYTAQASLYKGKTQFQEIELLQTEQFGNVLLLDGVTQVAERGDWQYHEPMTHFPLIAHPDPRDVLVIGGGDGGILRELAHYKSLEHIDFVELDEEVVAFSKQYLESVNQQAFDDPRVHMHFTDGRAFVESKPHRYDAIIMDPPSYGRGPGGEVWKLEDNLYPFVELCSRVLSDKPLFVVLNSYTTGLAPSVLGYILQMLVGRKFGGTVTWDELGLPCTESGMALPCGATGRWFSE